MRLHRAGWFGDGGECASAGGQFHDPIYRAGDDGSVLVPGASENRSDLRRVSGGPPPTLILCNVFCPGYAMKRLSGDQNKPNDCCVTVASISGVAMGESERAHPHAWRAVVAIGGKRHLAAVRRNRRDAELREVHVIGQSSWNRTTSGAGGVSRK